MKKIFAIALALVMVLSLSSAFAAFCVNPDWSCAADVCYTGHGKVEVIPYVKGNDCNTGNSWTPSTCAGAVNTEDVYYAIKLTVDAEADEKWWEEAYVELEVKGMQTAFGVINGKSHNKFTNLDDLVKALSDDKATLEAGDYYFVANGANVVLVKAKDFVAGTTTLFTSNVKEAAKAKVCATLKSEYQSLVNVKVGDYIVNYMGNHINVQNGKTGDDYKSANFFLNADKKIEYVTYVVGSTTYTFNYDDGANFLSTDVAGVVKGYACAPFNWLKTVMNNFKFDFRTTCYTEKAFKANFGWKDKVESCFSWNSNVQAVVDAECVVAIPKTGDKGLLWWLF